MVNKIVNKYAWESYSPHLIDSYSLGVKNGTFKNQ